MVGILNSLDKFDKCNEILLISNSIGYRDKFFVLLEGITDVKFFNKHFSSEKISFFSVYSGKSEVIESTNYLLSKGLDKVFGVCDADFDHIDNKFYDNIYLTDFHDVEMFFIDSSCLYKIFCEYVASDNHDVRCIYDNFEEKIRFVCSQIGIIRLINYRNKEINLNFKGMNFSQFISISESDINFDIEVFVDFILERSNRVPNFCSREYVLSEYSKINYNNFDYRHLCNGHDFVNILALLFKSLSNNKNISPDRLEENMRMGYESNCFEKTNLYGYIVAHLQ
ncbi:TPA: DUF4435 domain-containing protein [Haemophilus influenzae]